MSARRHSPPIPEEDSMKGAPLALSRSRASSSSLASVSSVSSVNGIITAPSATTAAATAMGSPTAVLTNGHSNSSSNNYTSHTNAASSSASYPAFPYRNKSRTPSVSSTSTITQPVHSLLQTSSGILPKRHVAAVSAAPTLSTASASASLSPTSSPTGTLNNATNPKYIMANGSSNATVDFASANGRPTATSNAILVLEPTNGSFALKSLELPENTRVKIGRQTGVTTAPNPSNGYFDSKVLSRVHAEVWSENSKVYIRDLKSSNGTFLNGKRLCPENVESEPFVLNQNDHLEFGIDIMDEDGSLLHEKVACKIYVSRMSYPTPRGSPQESHAKLRSSSPSESTTSSAKSGSTTNAVTGGQSTNIDLIISRLQNELTRSQETNADLGELKQGLGELERAITVSAKEDAKANNTNVKVAEALIQTVPTVDYEKLLEENAQIHAEEIAKMKKMLDDTQAELDAYIQKTHLLEPLVEEDEILRRDIAQSAAELTQVKLERDLAKDSMSELINEHQQTMESLRKEHEVAMESFQKEHEAAMDSLRKEQEMVMSVLEAQHKENLECVGREATQAQELLMTKHQEEITRLSTTAPQAEDVVTLQLEISSVQTQVNTLQETIEKQAKEITELAMIKAALARDLTEAKAEVTKSEGELKKAKQLAAQAELSTLTPTSPKITSGSFMCKHPECHEQLTTTTTKASTILSRESKDVAARHEFSWAQFIFPLGKKGTAHVNQTPTSMLMSGGFMLVGLGAFVFMRRSGFTVK